MRLFISAEVLGLQSFAAANSVLLGMKMSSDTEENNTQHFWEIVPDSEDSCYLPVQIQPDL